MLSTHVLTKQADVMTTLLTFIWKVLSSNLGSFIGCMIFFFPSVLPGKVYYLLIYHICLSNLLLSVHDHLPILFSAV